MNETTHPTPLLDRINARQGQKPAESPSPVPVARWLQRSREMSPSPVAGRLVAAKEIR